MNPYVVLTREFNEGRLRAVLSSGQAVVLLRLSIASKDGDWIVRESEEDLAHLRTVLGRHGARYRFGAPLDVRWLRGGWSSHFEFAEGGVRLRTDFVSRPPRLEPGDLASLWDEQARTDVPCVDARRLILLKMTGRERDYAVIGELARRLSSPRDRLRFGRSALDLIDAAAAEPALAHVVLDERPLLSRALARDVEGLEAALDAERRALMRADARRVSSYLAAARGWSDVWPGLDRSLAGLPLAAAHAEMVARASSLLPERPRVDA